MRPGRRWDKDIAKVFRCLAERPVIAQHDVIALAAFDRLGETHATKRSLNNSLEDAHIDIAPGQLSPVRRDFQIFAAEHAVGEGRARTWQIRHGSLNIACDALDFDQIVAGDLDTDRGAHAG